MPSTTPTSSSLDQTLRLVGDRWSMLIVRAALRGVRRFDDFCTDLDIARPVLTNRLRRLVDGGVLAREQYQAHPPRFEYRLTPAGVALSPALVALVRWAEQHAEGGEPGPMLVHSVCGTEFEQGFWCRTCATTFGPAAIRAAARDTTTR